VRQSGERRELAGSRARGRAGGWEPPRRCGGRLTAAVDAATNAASGMRGVSVRPGEPPHRRPIAPPRPEAPSRGRRSVVRGNCHAGARCRLTRLSAVSAAVARGRGYPAGSLLVTVTANAVIFPPGSSRTATIAMGAGVICCTPVAALWQDEDLGARLGAPWRGRTVRSGGGHAGSCPARARTTPARCAAPEQPYVSGYRPTATGQQQQANSNREGTGGHAGGRRARSRDVRHPR